MHWDVFMIRWRVFLLSEAQLEYHAVMQYVRTDSMMPVEVEEQFL